MDKETLMQQAREVKQNAYVPYSKFHVGAAFLMNDGKTITGVNVENVSFGATNCAERTAMFTAIAAGYKKGDFDSVAVAGDTENFLPPCAICRQVMAELCPPDMQIHLTNAKGEIATHTLRELLPLAFTDLDM